MWIVMTSSAQAPAPMGRNGDRYGVYRNIALIEIYNHLGKEGWRPSRIDKRLMGILKVEHWGRFYVGKSENCAYQRTLKEANRVAEERNAIAVGTAVSLA